MSAVRLRAMTFVPIPDTDHSDGQYVCVVQTGIGEWSIGICEYHDEDWHSGVTRDSVSAAMRRVAYLFEERGY